MRHCFILLVAMALAILPCSGRMAFLLCKAPLLNRGPGGSRLVKHGCYPRRSTAASSLPGVIMLRRSDRGADSDESPEAVEAAINDTPDIGDWKISKKKAPGIVDAASDIMEWMLRVQIDRDENDPKMKAIADEFRFEDNADDIDLNSVLATSGGAAGRTVDGEESSWFRAQKIKDKDPSGVIARAELLIEEAEAVNMTYADYLEKMVQVDPVRTVEVISSSNRRLPDGTFQFVTAPHAYPINTIMPRVPWSTCWYGLFFEIEAKHRDVEIMAIYSQAGIYWRDTRDVVNITVYTCEGEARGKEKSREQWQMVGHQEDTRMVKVNFTMNSNPNYGQLPLAKPLIVKAGTVRGMLVHTSSHRGLALRAKDLGSWAVGEVTDADDDLNVRAGLLPCGLDDVAEKVFETTFHSLEAGAFVGIIDYRILD